MHPSFRPLRSTYNLGGLSSLSQIAESHLLAGILHCLHVFCVCARFEGQKQRKYIFQKTFSNPADKEVLSVSLHPV